MGIGPMTFGFGMAASPAAQQTPANKAARATFVRLMIQLTPGLIMAEIALHGALTMDGMFIAS